MEASLKDLCSSCDTHTAHALINRSIQLRSQELEVWFLSHVWCPAPMSQYYWGGQGGGANSQQAHGVVTTSMRRNDVASTSFRRHVPTRFLINQCQIITLLILKSDNIENSRTELKGIVLQVHSNQIKVTFIIILPFNMVHLSFFSCFT